MNSDSHHFIAIMIERTQTRTARVTDKITLKTFAFNEVKVFYLLNSDKKIHANQIATNNNDTSRITLIVCESELKSSQCKNSKPVNCRMHSCWQRAYLSLILLNSVCATPINYSISFSSSSLTYLLIWIIVSDQITVY